VNRLVPRVWASLIGGSLAVLAMAGPAHAAEGRIVSSTQDEGVVEFVFTADELAAGITIDHQTARVTADGLELPTQGAPLEESEAPPQRTAVLVMDVSNSMAGERLVAAKDAAIAFLDSVPDGVEVGLVTFSGQVDRPVEPTPDHDVVRTTVEQLQTSPNTALYDGVIAGIEMASSGEGTASVLVLADGGDSQEGTSLEDAVAAAEAGGVHIDVVGIGEAELDNLSSIATAGGGTVVGSGDDISRLSDIFVQAALAIANQILVTAQIVPAVANREVRVVVSATAGEETVSAEGNLLLGGALTDPTQISEIYGARPVQGEGFIPSAWLIAALGGLFVALTILLGVALARATAGTSMEGRVRRRLSVYTLAGRKPVKQHETTVLGQTALARQAVGIADRLVQDRDFEGMLARRLDAAGLSLRPAEWLLIHVGIALASGLLLLLVSGLRIVPALLGIVLGVAGPFLFLVVKESRRKAAFLGQLPETLQLMAGSLSAGYSMPQAIDTVVRDGSPPISSEFNRALVESRLGVPVEDALEGVADRMKSRDFAWVIMAIRIQRQVGGNLAELLTTVAATLRERERLRRQVQVLSAEGRLSAWILGVLPLGFALYLLMARGTYLEPLWTDPLGWALLVIGTVLMGAGALWLRKVVQVEV
jgi:tight adherence protein B